MPFFRLPFFILLLLKQWHTLRIWILTKSVSFQKTFVLVKNIDFCKEKKGPGAFEKSQNHIFFCVGLCVIFPGLLRVSVHGKCLDWKVDFDFDVRFLSLLYLPFFFLVAKIPFVFQVLNGLENTLHNSRVSCSKSS